MDLNKKTINTVVNALQIAKKITELSILHERYPSRVADTPISRIRLSLPGDIPLSDEQMKEYSNLIQQFKGLAERQNYELFEE